MTAALMWEAKAPEGRGPDLLAWCRDQILVPAPIRRETYTSGDRVLTITWWNAALDADLPELPDAPEELSARPVHRWRFEQVQGEERYAS